MNEKILFDYTWIFRSFDLFRILLKNILTKLRLRDKQSCKYCGRDQHVVWKCKDEIWNKLPKKWHNKALCLECFGAIYPTQLSFNDIEILKYNDNRLC